MNKYSRQHRTKNIFWRYSIPQTLSEDITQFTEWIAPTEDEIIKRENLEDKIISTIKNCCGNCKPVVFGSTATGLFSPLSDIDIVVLEADVNDMFYNLASYLQNQKFVVQLKIIPHAKVPLIKFIDASTNIQVDICFGVETSTKNITVVKHLLKKHPNAKPIFVIVKYLLLMHGLNEVYTGGLGSYALLLMIISFIQQKSNSFKNKGDMLIQFFYYYGIEFDYYEKGISVRGEGSLFLKHEKGFENTKQPYMLCIEDPTNPSNDVTRASWNILAIQNEFRICFRTLSLRTTLLDSIFPSFYIPRFHNRKKIKQKNIKQNNENTKYQRNSKRKSRASKDTNWIETKNSGRLHL